MSNSYPSPISRPGEGKVTLPPWENLLFGVVVLSAAGYAGCCAVRLYTLNALVHVMNQITAGNSPSDASVTSKINADNSAANAVQALFWAMYVFFIIWTIVLNSRFRAAGRAGALRKLPAWITWRVGVIVSILILVVVRSTGNDTTPSQVISDAHKEMLYIAVRMIIGGVYVWCAFSMHKAARSLRTGALTPSGPSAPAYPAVYPPAQSYPTTPTNPAGPNPLAGDDVARME
jgi:hypothetical protein